MSRVHDALRRAEQVPSVPDDIVAPPPPPSPTPSAEPVVVSNNSALTFQSSGSAVATLPETDLIVTLPDLSKVREIPFTPAKDSHLIDAAKPHQAPAEEFRSLRTRLNHMQSVQPISSVVVTSPSPAEGKSFAAINLALAEAQLEENPTLVIDCDFRRPIVHSSFQMERGPGLTDWLLGKAQLQDCLVKLAGLNLYILPAGSAVINPLELLNLREMKLLVDALPRLFRWTILDSPPLLFAADASLLSTLCSGTILVVRLGNTTVDTVTRAIQSLCENNVLGIVVNGARRGELYSKYNYYHSYYTGELPAPVEEPHPEQP